jgi:PTH1 family peptidyl-tRNA hydrolase
MTEIQTNPNIELIAGLGNPGKKYAQTRHNVGFMVVDALANSKNVEFKLREKSYSIAEFKFSGGITRILKPLTYMNNSGISVGEVSRYYKIPPSGILTVTDDASMPLGKIRIRRDGSDGGHKGLRSVIENLGSSDFFRMRIGVGEPPEKMLLEDYVLSKFLNSEHNLLMEIINESVDLIYKITRQGFESTSRTYTVTI